LNLFATYHFTETFSGSFGGRYQSHSFNRLENDDFGSNYGSVSEFLVFDARVTWRLGEHASVAVGVDNLFDAEYFVAHPYPQRTFFLDAALRF
jgi:iron complex outermembrane receptor protein